MVTLATTVREPGGVGRHMLDLAAGLRERGVAVRFTAPADATALLAAARAARLDVVTLESLTADGGVLHLHLADTYDLEFTRLLLSSRARRWGGRVVTEHLPRTNASDPLLAPADARRRGAHLAKTVLKRLHLVLADRVVVVSSGNLDFVRRRYHVGTDRLRLVHNAQPPGAEPAPPPLAHDGPLRVIAVGALIRQKGHDVLIEAARRSAQPWQVSIVGTGPQQHTERLTAAALAVPGDRVSMLGWREDVHDLMTQHDVVAMPSRWEAFGYAALEALSMARALVASRVDGLDEVVESGVTGLLVPPDDPDALAAALDRLSLDRDLVVAMGSRGPARVADRFPFSSMVEDTMAIYQELGG